ncbi:hypothetical protein [Azospirillum doebereinerae]
MGAGAVAPTLTLPRWAGEGTAAERRQSFCPLPPPSGGRSGWGQAAQEIRRKAVP